MISFLLSVAFAGNPNDPIAQNPPTQPGQTQPGQTQPGTGTTGTGTGTTGQGQQDQLKKMAFEDIDANKDMSLDRTEVAQHQMLVDDFSVIDTDKNGKLSRTEFQAWHDRQVKEQPGQLQGATAPLFEDLDVNKDLSVDKTEIAQLQDLTRDFATYDTDKNGRLSRDEFLSWRATLGMPVFTDLDLNGDGSLDSSEINKNEMIKRDLSTIDTDKNGKISREEYQTWTSKAGRG